jgi:hypothetical protein
MRTEKGCWQEILSDALYAPSPHNIQPWRVRITGEYTAELLLDVARTLPFGDNTGCFTSVAMGAFVEAVRISAAHRGCILQWTLSHPFPDATSAIGGLQSFARLTLLPGAVSSNAYDPALLRVRRTSRRADYLPGSVNPASVAALKAVACDAGQTYVQFDDPAIIERILDRNITALLEDLDTPNYHRELVQWFRFSERQAERTRDGLSYRCMNTPPLLFWAATHFPALLCAPLLRPLVTREYRRQIGVVPALGVIAGEFRNPRQAVEAGRFLLRFWLELAKHGLYIHPFGNLVTNRRAADYVRDTTGIPDIWLIFRIGYSPEPPASRRRAIEEILVP